MNLEYEAAELSISFQLDSGYIEHVSFLDREKCPFPVRYKNGDSANAAMEKWLINRIMPENRVGAKKLFSVIGKNRLRNSIKSYGLSLSDGYWLKRPKDPVTWDEINFYKNKFSYDIGNFIFGICKKPVSVFSPDLTTNGKMPKTWRRKGSSIWLLKAGTYPYYSEPFNELLASEILRKISKVPYVDYSITKIRGSTVSVCENFIKEGFEYVPAADLMVTETRPDYLTKEMHLQERCQHFGIPGYKEFLDTIWYLDYLTANTDRHYHNFGFLYNCQQERFVGPAPIFDNGSSLWCDSVQIEPEKWVPKMEDQALLMARHLRHPEKISLLSGKDLAELVEEIYENSVTPMDRIKEIQSLVENRANTGTRVIENTIELQQKRTRRQSHVLEQQF